MYATRNYIFFFVLREQVIRIHWNKITLHSLYESMNSVVAYRLTFQGSMTVCLVFIRNE
jgi:hypothetical protein